MKTKRGLPDMTWLPDKQLWRKRGTYKGHKYQKTAREPEEVVAKIKAFEEWINNGMPLTESITVWQYIQRWYPAKVADLKPKSVEMYDSVVNNHIIPHIGNHLIKDVKPLDIDNIMAKLKGKSSSLRSKVLITAKQIFASAIENDLVIKNPCNNRKAGGVKAKPKVPLTHYQQDTLIEAVKGTRAELFTLLCLHAGLRREEALGLLWSNVYTNVDVPYLDVRHTTTSDASGRPIHSTELKSEAAYRTIPLTAQLTEALLRWHGKKDSIFVVPSERTMHEMSPTACKRMWRLVTGYYRDLTKRDEFGTIQKDKYGRSLKVKVFKPGLVDFYVHPHLLRHTYITELCASGMDIKKIQYLAGHEDVTMTLNIYTQVTQNRPEQLTTEIIRIFSRLPAGLPEESKTRKPLQRNA